MSFTTDQQSLLGHYVKKILAAPVYELAVRTPLQPAPALSEALGNQVLLKREDLQPTFSFKIRGAYNKLVHLSEAQKARGVVTASAGNHAQGVALAARELGISATIVMPLHDAATESHRGAQSRRRGGVARRKLSVRTGLCAGFGRGNRSHLCIALRRPGGDRGARHGGHGDPAPASGAA